MPELNLNYKIKQRFDGVNIYMLRDDRKYLVYMHTCPNNKKYIGITCCTTKIRWGLKGTRYKYQTHFYNAIEKYGWDNIEHNILFEGLSKEEACSKEKELIAKYHTTNKHFGYNHTYGGDMAIPTEEARKKMSKSRPTRKVVRCVELNKTFESATDAEKELSIARTSIISCCRNKQYSNTAGGYHWEYVDPKLKTKYQPDGFRQNKCHKAVRCIETGAIYFNMREAGRECGIDNRCIWDCCRGKASMAHGLHWEYVDEELRNKYKPKIAKFSPKPKQVRCVETNVVYDSIAEAQKQTGINNIGRCLKGKCFKAGGYMWEYVDTSLNAPQIVAKKNKQNKRLSPIRCIETGIAYNSIKEACEKCNLKYKSFQNMMLLGGRYKGQHWEYV